MTLYAPLILLGLPRNHHMQHLPTSDITRSSQDQIKLGINNTVVIIKWPQGAWFLPTILAQYHEYPTTRYPRYHGDHSGDHNHDQHLVSNGDLSGDHNHDQHLAQTVIFPAITTMTNTWSPTSSSTSCQSVLLKISAYIYITYKSFRHVSVDRTMWPSTNPCPWPRMRLSID